MCSNRVTSTFIPGLAAICAAAALSLPAAAIAADNTYLVLMNDAGKIGQRFSSQVDKAGGEIRLVVDEIGLVVATSGEAGFKARMESLREVQSVAYSVPIQTDNGKRVHMQVFFAIVCYQKVKIAVAANGDSCEIEF